ncbi:hypothetical protein DFH05DRAFT_1488610 [Lentinula detonsa]|uniref:LIM zinc-binding domain-containing protein n=1 Tax=Lentinula detonsa TaxID=2804962 RepID=A0A9W8P2I0_9AGAR|nr:hypothetical protein DFH05DRAFT_1488610 [Lentinula detonsa]
MPVQVKNHQSAYICSGCSLAILKGFVENERNEYWHPKCYLMHRVWNVKISPVPGFSAIAESDHEEEEQIRMERKVHRTWSVLSAFDESSAACISKILRALNEERLLDAVRMAENLVLHIEVLFATIDDLDFQFAKSQLLQSLSYTDDAWKLCRKVLDLFTVISRTKGPASGSQATELTNVVKGLAQDLRALIQIALSSALKLEHETAGNALEGLLEKLYRLVETETGGQSVRRMTDAHYTSVTETNPSTQGVIFGFRSLAPEIAGESPFSNYLTTLGMEKISHQLSFGVCVKCGKVIEENCIRLGTYHRWHTECLECNECGVTAVISPPKRGILREFANVPLFVYEMDSGLMKDAVFSAPTVILCPNHAHAGCCRGFETVHAVEQYAFLLHIALRRLYVFLRQRDELKARNVHNTTISAKGVQKDGTVRGFRSNPSGNSTVRGSGFLLTLGICQCLSTAWIAPFGIFSQSTVQYNSIFRSIAIVVALSTWIWTAILLEYNNRPHLSHPLTRGKIHLFFFAVFMLTWMVLGIMLVANIPEACGYVYASNDLDLGSSSCVPSVATGSTSLLLNFLSVLAAIIVYRTERRRERMVGSDRRFA